MLFEQILCSIFVVKYNPMHKHTKREQILQISSTFYCNFMISVHEGTGYFLTVILLVSFRLPYRNVVIPLGGDEGTGFFLTSSEAASEEKSNSPRVTKGLSQFPMPWFSRHGGKLYHEWRSHE